MIKIEPVFLSFVPFAKILTRLQTDKQMNRCGCLSFTTVKTFPFRSSLDVPSRQDRRSLHFSLCLQKRRVKLSNEDEFVLSVKRQEILRIQRGGIRPGVGGKTTIHEHVHVSQTFVTDFSFFLLEAMGFKRWNKSTQGYTLHFGVSQ